MKKKNEKIEKKICVMSLKGGGVYVPIGIFRNIDMHKNIDCHLKI